MLSLRCARWVAGAFVLPIVIACSKGTGSVDEKDPPTPPAPGAQDSFTIGGNVSGLAGSGLVLQNNGAGDLAVSADGAFTFTTRVATGTTYHAAARPPPTPPPQPRRAP